MVGEIGVDVDFGDWLAVGIGPEGGAVDVEGAGADGGEVFAFFAGVSKGCFCCGGLLLGGRGCGRGALLLLGFDGCACFRWFRVGGVLLFLGLCAVRVLEGCSSTPYGIERLSPTPESMALRLRASLG